MATNSALIEFETFRGYIARATEMALTGCAIIIEITVKCRLYVMCMYCASWSVVDLAWQLIWCK